MQLSGNAVGYAQVLAGKGQENAVQVQAEEKLEGGSAQGAGEAVPLADDQVAPAVGKRGRLGGLIGPGKPGDDKRHTALEIWL